MGGNLASPFSKEIKHWLPGRNYETQVVSPLTLSLPYPIHWLSLSGAPLPSPTLSSTFLSLIHFHLLLDARSLARRFFLCPPSFWTLVVSIVLLATLGETRCQALKETPPPSALRSRPLRPQVSRRLPSIVGRYLRIPDQGKTTGFASSLICRPSCTIYLEVGDAAKPRPLRPIPY
jgi:hypothetical protein